MTATASMDTRRIHGFCGLCIARCGTVATVENGRFTRLDPDPMHPTGAALCAKGRAAPEIVYARDRLTKPLERTRPKGDPDPGWREISWDDALAGIAMQMQRISSEHGPEAFAVSVSSPSTTAIGDSAPFIRRLMNAYGTPNLVHALEVCGWGRGGATQVRLGCRQRCDWWWRWRHGRHRECRLYHSLGLQPLVDAPHTCNGDHRRPETRRQADRHRSAAGRPRQ